MEQREEPPAGMLDELARVPVDEALDALNHSQRREVLMKLLTRDSQESLPVVFADSKGSADELDRAVTADYAHLSKLAEYGFISWNRDTQEVTQGSNFGDIDPLLQLLADNEAELPDSWL
ncbi:transcriptional regulator [Halorubrum ejinorense]|uniref:Transcriptional regulator n=1 Tax=Halorubrum ejinorense TaxID=425309 RepID=A0AAV3SUQ4_9EURY